MNTSPIGHHPNLKITRRRLPHWELPGLTYLVTFVTWERLELPPAARQLVLDACCYFHNRRYTLHIAVVMPDHVHLLLTPHLKDSHQTWTLSQILHSIKSYTAKKILTVITHQGVVWMPERHDHLIRDDREFETA
jgi:REP element-mobilizing transposase RayT